MTVTNAEPAGGKPVTAPRVVEVVVSVPTVVKALGIFFGVLLVFLARDALLSIALSLVFVLGLDPPVSALERRGWGRGKAAMLVMGLLVLAVFVIVVWAIGPLWGQIDHPEEGTSTDWWLLGLVSRTEAEAGATWKLVGFTVSEP